MLERMLADGMAVPPARSNPPPKPEQKTYVVQPGDTVESIAAQHHVTPQALASANDVAHYASSPAANGYRTQYQALPAGMELVLPPAEVAPDRTDAAHTPQQKTDAAAKAYQQALKDRDQAMRDAPPDMGMRSVILKTENAHVADARAAFDAAVQAEIDGKVADATVGVPPQYQTPAAQLAKTYGDQIVARYADDANLQAAAQTVAHTAQVKATADSLIPGFAGPWTAAEKLQQIDLQGQPQEVVDAVLSDPRVQQWIKQAAADIGKPYEGVGSGNLPGAYRQADAAAKALAAATGNMSPQLTAAVVQASMPTIQKIAQLQSSNDILPFDSVYAVLSRVGDDAQGKAAMAQAAQAFADNADRLPMNFANAPEGVVANAASLNTDARFALALADAFRENGDPATAARVEQAAAAGIGEGLKYQGDGPKAAYEKAHAAAQDKDKHLAELLAKAGPLTKQQTEAYIKAYREDPDNAKVYKADAEAAAHLGSWMKANQRALLFAAGNDPEAAKQLYGMLQDLAQSGQGATALQFAGDIKNDPKAAAAFAKFSDYQADFLPKALTSAQGQLLLESDGNTKEAGNKLLELADPLFKGKDGWDAVRENYARLANGETKAFNAAQFADGYRKMGAAGKAWAVASIMTSTLNGANAGEVSDLIASFATAGANTDGLATGAAQALADAGRLGRFTESAATFAKFASRFVPALGVVASSAAFASDFGKAVDGNPAYAIALAGDVFSIIGGVLETTGIGEVPGAIVTGIGAVLSAPFELVGGIIDGNKEAKAFAQEEEKYLKQVGEDDTTSKAMAESNPQQVKDLLATGMTPAEIQDLGKLDPLLMQSVHHGAPYFGDIPALQKRTGLSGDGLYALLKAADAGGKPGEGAAYMAHVLGHPNWFLQVAGAQDKAGLIAALKGGEKQLDNTVDSGDQTRAVHQAVQWLESH